MSNYMSDGYDYYAEERYEDLKHERLMKYKRDKNGFRTMTFPIRVMLFPVFLIVRLYRWTYYLD